MCVKVAGYMCRVSCATPVMGPLMGCVGVGIASSMAGQASLLCRDPSFRLDQRALKRVSRVRVVAQDVALDAFIGVLLFKVSLQAVWVAWV